MLRLLRRAEGWANGQSPEPVQSWHWRLKNELAALNGFNAQVQARLEAAPPPPPDAATISAVLLIFDELLTNVIKYAHPGEEPGHRQIDVHLDVQKGEVGIKIEDDGVPFDPSAARETASTADVPLEERAIGGWGLSLVRKLSDSMHYVREGERNYLTVHKRYPLTPPGAAQ
jgi:anti-sigma regulatory factor (Ser/Thr protein kinase)